jgi:hypothetical protein
MTQKEPAKGAGLGCQTHGCVLGVVGLVFLFFLMMAGIGMGLIELGWTLLFGWTAFILRVVPKISWDWGAVTTGIFFTSLLGIAGHYFLAWLTRGIAATRGVSFQWQRKWTFSGLLLLAFCFVVGMSVAGAAHQMGWILTSEESLFVDRYSMRKFVAINTVEAAIKKALLDTSAFSDLRKNVPALLRRWDVNGSASILDSVRLLVSISPSNTVNGVLILAMDKNFEKRYGARYVTAKESGPVAPNDVKPFIQSNAKNLVAF